MVRTIVFLLFQLLIFQTFGQHSKDIKLLVRSDDMGSARAANEACIRAVEEGISKTIEVMVPTPWFEGAVNLLAERPNIDVGIHLVLTSEWDGLKWRPISHVPSLTDPDGYFHPRFEPYMEYVSDTYLRDNDWTLEDVEKEFRAQIELGMKKIKNVSHVTGHMGCTRFTPEVAAIVKKLAVEYGLKVDRVDYEFKSFKGYSPTESYKKNLKTLLTNLESLESGTYLWVRHPGINNQEMQGMGHKGYYGVAFERGMETRVLTDPRVKRAIQKLNIQLISYADL